MFEAIVMKYRECSLALWVADVDGQNVSKYQCGLHFFRLPKIQPIREYRAHARSKEPVCAGAIIDGVAGDGHVAVTNGR